MAANLTKLCTYINPNLTQSTQGLLTKENVPSVVKSFDYKQILEDLRQKENKAIQKFLE